MELCIHLLIQKHRINSEVYWNYPGLSDACINHYNQPVLGWKILGEKTKILYTGEWHNFIYANIKENPRNETTFFNNIFRRGSSVTLEELIMWRGSPFESKREKREGRFIIKSFRHFKCI